MSRLLFTCFLITVLPLIPSLQSAEGGENRIHTQVQKNLRSGKKSNRLVNEKSPYLLQHAFNPVEWYPWGEEAFARARKENKPVFLSIGYSTCHWCHVMAHESFENEEIAALLNQWFVSIKVDREERPDIDQMYMAATQEMTGSGGWPMSVFLLPDGSPFYAGTYFPPVSSGGRPGLKDLLPAIHKAWQERKGDLQESARRMVAVLQDRNTASSATTIDADVFPRGYELLAEKYDEENGGFGQAPKFPRPVVFSFLFSYYSATGGKAARDMALHTLKKMAAGGMYDQIGGGFHRYSVDERWFVPHFEKMLYDQAQLVESYLDGFQITRDGRYAEVARETFAYLLRDLQDPGGGFYSAEDADSENPYKVGEHGEGAFYLWTLDDLKKRLGPDSAAVFGYRYGVEDKGNVGSDPMQEFAGKNILYQAHTINETAAHFKISREQAEKTVADAKKMLFTVREKRKRPHLDDKIITAWNGMMIGALAKGSRVLQDSTLLAAAVQTATFLKENLYDKASHSLQRRYRQGETGLVGQLDDYAFLVNGLLDLYQAGQDPQWLRWADELTRQQVALFWNESGNFFYDSVTDSSVKVRMRGGYDGAEPAANSVAAHNLLRLALLLNNPLWQQMARDLMESFAATVNRYPPALPMMLTAWRQVDSKPSQIVIAGERQEEGTKKMLSVVDQFFDPDRILLLADGAENQNYLAENLPFLQTIKRMDGKATAYLCVDFTCKMPVTDPAALRRQLEEMRP
ncbi:MAG: thioredoxin domain-containing protein [Deltaproteobacteria bacterium]|nr:thioredoxin domain-containing protein [Deltaproteobacteria bacterium]